MEWIAVEDKLPEVKFDDSSDDVLIAIEYDSDMEDDVPTICTGYFLNGEWWTYMAHNCSKIGDGVYKGDKITHWMPLPEPPNISKIDRLRRVIANQKQEIQELKKEVARQQRDKNKLIDLLPEEIKSPFRYEE